MWLIFIIIDTLYMMIVLRDWVQVNSADSLTEDEGR